jgi:hypothetical protein
MFGVANNIYEFANIYEIIHKFNHMFLVRWFFHHEDLGTMLLQRR